jgi:Pvc16 N-terminal domain
VSDYTVLRAASETLRLLLDTHITSSSEAGLAGVPIDLHSPSQLEHDNVDTAVSVWMYRVSVQPDLLNAPVTRSDDALVHNPLPLELSYLVTALHPDAKTQLQITGRVLQVIHDHPRLRGLALADDLAGSAEELHLSLEATTLSESSNLWYSLQSPFRLAVPLRLQAVAIDSHLPPVSAPPVLVRTGNTDEIVGVN